MAQRKKKIGTLPCFANRDLIFQPAFIRRNREASLLLFFMLAVPQLCRPESLAAKNERGNQLYSQGKYEDAEKAYLSAQVDNPGKPEILYNLGNSLIRQKRYREGVQALGQSIDKGDTATKEKGWYNTGNAFFSSGNYKGSADAFIQALKLDPSDRDAKHNLELSLRMLKEQEQEKAQKNTKRQDSQNSGQDKDSNGKGARPQQPNKDVPRSGDQRNRDEQAKTESSQSTQAEGSMTKQQAIQLLDAVQNEELREQRKLLESRAREKSNGKDW